MPPGLAATAKAGERPAKPESSLRRRLAGGDRRSIAGSARALGIVRAAPERVALVAALTADADWLVSMRALDLLEHNCLSGPGRSTVSRDSRKTM